MKKTIKLMAAVMILAVAFTSCKKYPDGPSLSLRTKKARLAGTWKVEKYMYNGADQTSFITAFLPNFTLTIDKAGSYNYKDDTNGTDDVGTWKFDDKKENYIETSTQDPSQGATTFEILKLENKSLWLKLTDKQTNDVEEIHYKQ